MRKDYYEILRVFPSSSMEEIKKSYRKLALRYHPDKNQHKENSDSEFLEIIEAYEILSDVSKRLEYDYENGFRSRQHQVLITPPLLLEEARRLRRYVYAVNLFSLDQQALRFHLNRLLSVRNVNLLLDFNHHLLIQQILRELIDASRFLHYSFLPEVVDKMNSLAGNDRDSVSMVAEYSRQRKNRHLWDKYLPFVVLMVTLLLCTILYFIG